MGHKRLLVPVEPLAEFQRETGISTKELAQAMGVSVGGIAGYLSRKQMPAMALVALEALKRRRQGANGRDQVFFATVPPGKVTQLKLYCEASGVKLTLVEIPS